MRNWRRTRSLSSWSRWWPTARRSWPERRRRGGGGGGDGKGDLEEGEEPVVVVEVVADGTALVPGAAAAGEVVGDAAAGGLTANCDPAATVTWAPSVVGPRAVMTAPDSDRATAWAAASSAGVFWA